MNIQIVLKNEFSEIDNTKIMAEILKQIASELEDGLIDGFYNNFEWHYIFKEI